MPSDPRVALALEILAPSIERYRTAVATTLEEVRGWLEAGRAGADARARRLEDQLGPFASGRLDPARLASVLGRQDTADPVALQRLARASDTLRNIVSRGPALFTVDVPPGSEAHTVIQGQVAESGRAFAAARIAAAARQGGGSGLDEARALNEFPFTRWSTAERKLAPGLVATVRGTDIVPGALTPLLDGGFKLLLIVEAPCPPGLLARLITPGVLVIQAHGAEGVRRLATCTGPAIAAIVPDTAVQFAHDPAAGPHGWQRLSLQLPADLRPVRIDGLTPAQQMEEVRLLETLAARPSPQPVSPAAPAEAGPAGDPVDRLAAWLLQQAQLAAPVAGD